MSIIADPRYSTHKKVVIVLDILNLNLYSFLFMFYEVDAYLELSKISA